MDMLHITDSAAERIRFLAHKDGRHALRFRVGIAGGGCSGFQYEMKLDDASQPDDHLFIHNEAEVVVDDLSLGFLKNATLDYVETLGSAGFEIKNPNSTAKCGCGNSFAV